MLELAYVLLAHESAEQVASQVRLLLAADPTGHVVVHYDRNAPKAEFASLEAALADSPRAHLVSDRVPCTWGGFGLVDGVVRALRVIREHQLACDYIYLLSSSCLPIKPLAKLKRFLLRSDGMEFIEAHSADWITSGLREERYTLFHRFSFRKHRKLFDRSVKIQRALRVRRRPPADLSMRFGSQWWCLTRETCLAILDFIERRPRDYHYFRTTWIPDELFFQTMAASLAGERRIAGNNLTYFKFSSKGRPISFYDDHVTMIDELPFFFARKISLTASRLRTHLAVVAAGPDDGQDSPLDLEKERFQYDHYLSRSIDFARPGQIFYGGQQFTSWPSSLGSYTGVLGVLHGPPSVTRMVGERLRAVANITLLGRVFQPDMVNLATAGDDFEGFRPDDHRIRDLDRPLYLSRLLARCTGFPILEMAPGDDNDGEWHFQQSKSVLFMPCVPTNAEDEDWRRLYWLLVAAGFPKKPPIRPYEMREVENFNLLRSAIDGYVDRVFPGSHRKWVNDALLSPSRADRMLPIRWGRGAPMRPVTASRLTLRLNREFGPAITPVLASVHEVQAEFRNALPPNLLDGLPAAWARLFERFTLTQVNPSERESPQISPPTAKISLLRSSEKP